jgi:hypothetical protein
VEAASEKRCEAPVGRREATRVSVGSKETARGGAGSAKVRTDAFFLRSHTDRKPLSGGSSAAVVAAPPESR